MFPAPRFSGAELLRSQAANASGGDQTSTFVPPQLFEISPTGTLPPSESLMR